MSVRGIFLFLAAWVCCSSSLYGDAVRYSFRGTNGMRLDFERHELFGPLDYGVIPGPNIVDCYVPVVGCGTLVAILDPSGAPGLDMLGFIQQHPLQFADPALSQIGAAYTISSSVTQGRLAVYMYNPEDVYEYYFKDSTGTRTFRFYTDTPLVDDFQLPENAFAGCALLPGQPCTGGQMELDLADNDAISFANAGWDGTYLFPQLAFSKEGIHYTNGGLTSGVLRVQRMPRSQIRNEPPIPLPDPLDPGTDPAPVPEPSTMGMVGLAGAAWLWLRRGSGARTETPDNR
jgi:hypothetical protein